MPDTEAGGKPNTLYYGDNRQILTIREFLEGKTISAPAWRKDRTVKRAPRAKGEAAAEGKLPGVE